MKIGGDRRTRPNIEPEVSYLPQAEGLQPLGEFSDDPSADLDLISF